MYVRVTLVRMSNMRTILKTLMDSQGHTGHSLEDLCGVPAATTYRFLTGKHGEPKGSTIRKWAQLYGVTEAQLRGYEPIQGVLIPAERQATSTTGMPHLTREERNTLKILHHIRKESKHAWLKIGLELSIRDKEQETGEESKLEGDWPTTDRRVEDRRQTGGSNSYRRAVEQRGLSDSREKQKAS